MYKIWVALCMCCFKQLNIWHVHEALGQLSPVLYEGAWSCDPVKREPDRN